MRRAVRSPLSFVALLLAACGGGGGEPTPATAVDGATQIAPTPATFPVRAIASTGFNLTLRRVISVGDMYVYGARWPWQITTTAIQDHVPEDPRWISSRIEQTPNVSPGNTSEQRLLLVDGDLKGWTFAVLLPEPNMLTIDGLARLPDFTVASVDRQQFGAGTWSSTLIRGAAWPGRAFYRVLPVGIDRVAVCLSVEIQGPGSDWMAVGRELCQVGDAQGHVDTDAWPFQPPPEEPRDSQGMGGQELVSQRDEPLPADQRAT